ncbi:hypothetical protein LQL77_30380 [Rhodococcus cerastii]|nr:hypothetical protein [Rhodococcus cerastii]
MLERDQELESHAQQCVTNTLRFQGMDADMFDITCISGRVARYCASESIELQMVDDDLIWMFIEEGRRH